MYSSYISDNLIILKTICRIYKKDKQYLLTQDGFIKDAYDVFLTIVPRNEHYTDNTPMHRMLPPLSIELIALSSPYLLTKFNTTLYVKKTIINNIRYFGLPNISTYIYYIYTLYNRIPLKDAILDEPVEPEEINGKIMAEIINGLNTIYKEMRKYNGLLTS